MTKEELYEYLKQSGVTVEMVEHRAVYKMSNQITSPHPEAIAKNLFIRDIKKQSYYLVSVKGHKRLDLKELRKEQGTQKLTFASADELEKILGLQPGTVSPLGLLHQGAEKVTFLIDQDFQDEDIIGLHPNENTATIFLKVKDLIRLLTVRGSLVKKVAI